MAFYEKKGTVLLINRSEINCISWLPPSRKAERGSLQFWACLDFSMVLQILYLRALQNRNETILKKFQLTIMNESHIYHVGVNFLVNSHPHFICQAWSIHVQVQSLWWHSAWLENARGPGLGVEATQTEDGSCSCGLGGAPLVLGFCLTKTSKLWVNPFHCNYHSL